MRPLRDDCASVIVLLKQLQCPAASNCDDHFFITALSFCWQRRSSRDFAACVYNAMLELHRAPILCGFVVRIEAMEFELNGEEPDRSRNISVLKFKEILKIDWSSLARYKTVCYIYSMQSHGKTTEKLYAGECITRVNNKHTFPFFF